MKTKNVTEKNMKVCLVGSSGGHLTHLYMLKPFWKDKNRFWVTFDMVELYTIMRYLQYDTLQKMGLSHFDDWAASFGETVTAIELSPEGTGYRAKTRFARFFNLPELISLFKESADVQTADMLNLPVPQAEYINEVLKPSETQEEMVSSFADRAEAVRNGSVNPKFDNMLKITNDGRKLALDQRLMNEMLNDENVPVPSIYNKENKAYGKETTYTIAPVILWDSSRVWKILTAYVYTGAMVLGKTKTLISGKSIVRTVPKGKQFITAGTHEAIVSREEFEKAQLVIKSNSHKVLMGGVDFPLKGKVRCGNCRRVMAHNFKQAVPTFWCREGLELVGQTQCTSEVFQVSDIENEVLQALKKELSLLDRKSRFRGENKTTKQKYNGCTLVFTME